MQRNANKHSNVIDWNTAARRRDDTLAEILVGIRKKYPDATEERQRDIAQLILETRRTIRRKA